MYIAQAYKFKHDVWRYVVGTIIIFLIGWQLIGTIPLTIVSFLEAGSLPEFLSASESSFASLFPAKSNLYLLLILLTFIGGFIALIFVIKYIHKQTLTQLTTSRKKIDWGRFFFGFGLIATLSIVTTVLDFYSNPENYVVQFELIPFLIMLVIVVTLIPIQTSFEEYFFRGYLMQGIGIAAKNKWVPLLITSVIFGGLHFFNPEVEKIGNIAMVYYIGTGFFLGIITLMDEGMEISLGFHAGTNLIIALLVTSDWTVFQTNSILLDLSEPGAGIEVVLPVFILYPMLLAIMAWKYKWTGWREKLFGKISPPDALGTLKE
ncbi:CPBP family intramembrane metalloprotease [Flavobacteriaceae bacterium]|jgi:membrane protease YdiL (CAAX protease family)|nr:CPBP family intramembrane metalloprotease domain-containing protein [Flavobacteriaceae bacterium]MDA8977856.1 CPBP family intramembrane metalloprotease [bacterium]MDA9341979.1 CPBP family intramembrane metalloprotease [Flavobacteriaceae bacterium]MDB9913072.1 CPBP family intramembrane metalloprotease [Flavobacteriaceae bacterium]MDB9993361.1 CPBP family intramembrane metalloprotease [Flavobacteriaceae bacterium]|tara:strand:+ start:15745 stop:16701 length:957 start_codon:yes stop_codon:yes gene_type:complete